MKVYGLEMIMGFVEGFVVNVFGCGVVFRSGC